MKDLDFLTVSIIIAMVTFVLLSLHSQGVSNQKLDECEKNLPRNQHCELVAVPMEIKP